MTLINCRLSDCGIKLGALSLMILLFVSIQISGAFATVSTHKINYSHNGTELQGYLAKPSNIEGNLPAVMIVHQWMGLGEYEKMRARQLAEMGYVAFAADVYGADTRPKTTHEASLASTTFRENRNLYRKRLNNSLKTMKSLENVDSTRVAAIGYCFGGTGVLELARSGANLDAVVSFHGGLSNPNPEDAKNIQAEVQVHHGAEDSHVTQEHVLSFWDAMNNNATVSWDLNVYSNAPHGFTEPGTDSYNKRADRLSWRAMKKLFTKKF